MDENKNEKRALMKIYQDVYFDANVDFNDLKTLTDKIKKAEYKEKRVYDRILESADSREIPIMNFQMGVTKKGIMDLVGDFCCDLHDGAEMIRTLHDKWAEIEDDGYISYENIFKILFDLGIVVILDDDFEEYTKKQDLSHL